LPPIHHPISRTTANEKRKGFVAIMSAFGKRGPAAGGSPRGSFGVARPMKGGAIIPGGDQFPPLDSVALPVDEDEGLLASGSDAMDRLSARQAGPSESGSSRQEGFEASIHKIKEQVLPRLLERVDPEAAATLSKDELAEEFRPIIGEVLAELKLTLNRREQFALEKVLVDELLGLGPLEELLADSEISDIMVNGPDQTYIEKKGKLQLAQIQFRDEEHLFQIAQRIVNKVGRRVDQTTPLADARLRTAAASTSSSRRCRCAAPPSRS
jgi:pilus assembly protein CpaF